MSNYILNYLDSLPKPMGWPLKVIIAPLYVTIVMCGVTAIAFVGGSLIIGGGYLFLKLLQAFFQFVMSV